MKSALDAHGAFYRSVRSRSDGMASPGADLLASGVYAVLIADVTDTKCLGRGIVEDIECEHLAFRNPDVDWQM
jgi:hypothetical protein